VSCRRKKKGGEMREERESNNLLFNNQRVSTVFPYALGNTVETQWTKLNIGLLLWDVFVVFSLFFFSLNEGKQTPLGSLLLVLLLGLFLSTESS
jgi:hypothetical protein